MGINLNMVRLKNVFYMCMDRSRTHHGQTKTRKKEMVSALHPFFLSIRPDKNKIK